jgi:hypothetical protein
MSPRKIFLLRILVTFDAAEIVAILACAIPMEALTGSISIFLQWRDVLTCCHLPFQTIFCLLHPTLAAVEILTFHIHRKDALPLHL